MVAIGLYSYVYRVGGYFCMLNVDDRAYDCVYTRRFDNLWLYFVEREIAPSLCEHLKEFGDCDKELAACHARHAG